jgi:hypothetical protein
MPYRVTIFRHGAYGQAGEGRTKPQALAAARAKATAPFLTGIASYGERIGPDITDTIRPCFQRAAKAMRGRTLGRAVDGLVTIEIRRI